MLGGKSSVGRGDVIRYEDATHVVSYEARARRHAGVDRSRGRTGGGAATPPRPREPGPERRRGASPARGPPLAAAPTQAYVQGPQGELRAWRIEMVLSADAGKADRLEAYDDVNLRVEMRRATGERLTYFAEDERYVMTGSGGGTRVRRRSGPCNHGQDVGILQSRPIGSSLTATRRFGRRPRAAAPCAISPAR